MSATQEHKNFFKNNIIIFADENRLFIHSIERLSSTGTRLVLNSIEQKTLMSLK